jgi:hypothetical protein
MDNLKPGEREAMADRVISNARLLELLAEKDSRVCELEAELWKTKDYLQKIVQLKRLIDAIPI